MKVIIRSKPSIVQVSTKGIQGAPGSSGGATITAIATEAISGQRAVYAVAGGVALSSSLANSSCEVVGVTTAAAILGDQVTVKTSGELIDPSFAFSVGPVFLGLSGILTNTVPLTGSQVRIGKALSATKLLIEIEPPIKLL